MRAALCTEPILQYPDFSKQFTITTDVLDFAVGAILSQEHGGQEKPIAYYSRILGNAQKNYYTTEKECLAVVEALEHFQPYIYGRKFKLICNHEPLKSIGSMNDPGKRLIHWRLKLQNFDYEFIYKPGRLNANADALSRNPMYSESATSSSSESSDAFA